MIKLSEDNPWYELTSHGREVMRIGDGFIDTEVINKAILDIPRVNLMTELEGKEGATALEVMGLMVLRAMANYYGVDLTQRQSQT